MTQVWFCSDLHFGHKNIQKYRKCIDSDHDNRTVVQNSWNRLVRKRDLVYVLGDAAFTSDGLEDLAGLPGRKVLIKGNHDSLPTKDYLSVFEEVHGILKYKEFWLSHAPVHPNELRGRFNLHGHVHYTSLDDNKYINCCVERLVLDYHECLISLDQIRKELEIYDP